MTILAWQRGGHDGPAVILVHDWAAAGSSWEASGWVAELDRAGLSVLVPDLPGHGESADVLIPPDAEPAAWTAQAVLVDLARLGARTAAVVGAGAGCLTAGHLAVRAPDVIRRLVLVGADDRPLLPDAAEVAEALRDPTASVWRPDAAAAVSRARADRRHHLPTLAHWAAQMAWPAAPRLGALRTPVLLAVGTSDPRRERAPRLAQLFHDARLVTVPGEGEAVLEAPELMRAVGTFLLEGAGT